MTRVLCSWLVLVSLAWCLAGAAHAGEVAIGARIPGAPENPALIHEYALATGRPPVIVSYYREWNDPVFDLPSLRAVDRRSAVPMITWEPTLAGWHRGDHSTILQSIVDGKADRYLWATARVAARLTTPIFLRFAPEMNGGWFPWGLRTPGNSAALYVAAWRHVVEIFRSAGAHHVLWVWSPNVDDYGRLSFTGAYPGDGWVDWVALDGYNWGGIYGWQSFTAVFASSYDTLSGMTRKPMMIAEMASGETGGSKAAWITSAFDDELPRFARVRAVVWFNGTGGKIADFSYNSSPSAARAFRAALSSPRYGATAASLFAQPGRRRVFVPVQSPPAPKHGWARALDLASRYWPLLLTGALLVALVATIALRSRQPAKRAR